MILKLEGHRDLPNTTIDDVVRAVFEITRPDGPTYLVVERALLTFAATGRRDATPRR